MRRAQTLCLQQIAIRGPCSRIQSGVEAWAPSWRRGPSSPPSMAPRYAILVAGEPDQDVISKKGTFEDMFLRLLQDEGEEWALFFAYRGEFPSDEELVQFQGFVITGSVADAFTDEDWLVRLRQTVRKAAGLDKRVLGVCFGHQLVGTAYGARVGRAGCFECGLREVTVRPEAKAAVGEAAWVALLPDALVINECHQDQVLTAPEGATVLASSARCPIEMFAVGSNVLCLQGHPEFDVEVVTMLTDNRKHLIAADDLRLRDESNSRLSEAEHRAQLQRLCKAFLKGQ